MQPIEAQIISVQPPARLAPAAQLREPNPTAPAAEAVLVAHAAPQPMAVVTPQAPWLAQPALTEVQVMIPSGIMAGQQVSFITPDGQAMMATAAAFIPAGGSMRVQYRPRAPPAGQAPHLPTPVVDAWELDRRAMKWGWLMYAGGWLTCCMMLPHFALLIWLTVVAAYFCKSESVRRQSPLQRAPAIAALATCGAMAALCLIVTTAWITIICMQGIDGIGPLDPDGHHPLPTTTTTALMPADATTVSPASTLATTTVGLLFQQANPSWEVVAQKVLKRWERPTMFMAKPAQN